MLRYFKSKIWHSIIIIFSGAIATFAIPPISIFVFIFALGFGIYLTTLNTSLKKTGPSATYPQRHGGANALSEGPVVATSCSRRRSISRG